MTRAKTICALTTLIFLSSLVAPFAAAGTPAPCFTVDTQTGSTQHVFQFDASCTFDPTPPSNNPPPTPSALLEVRWDWENDGVYDEPAQVPGVPTYTTTKTASHQFSTPGTYRVRMEAYDPVSGNTASTAMDIVVSPPIYRGAYGHIYIIHTGSSLSIDNSYASSGWICTTTTGSSGVHVICDAPSPGTPYDGWQCSGLSVSAAASQIGSHVRGTTGCYRADNTGTTGDTGDVFGPNANGYASAPNHANIVRIECHANPTTLGGPVGPYAVYCVEP